MLESVGVAVIERISFRERSVLVWLLFYLVAYVPKNATHWLSSLQHEGAAGQIGVEMTHIRPPRLLSKEWSTYASSKRSTREVMVRVGIMGISMEYSVRDALHHVLIGYFTKLAEMLVPCKFERGKGFC